MRTVAGTSGRPGALLLVGSGCSALLLWCYNTYPPHIYTRQPAPAAGGGGDDATPKETLAYALISAWRCCGRWLPFSIIAVVPAGAQQPHPPPVLFSLILARYTHTRTITTPAAHNTTQTYTRALPYTHTPREKERMTWGPDVPIFRLV